QHADRGRGTGRARRGTRGARMTAAGMLIIPVLGALLAGFAGERRRLVTAMAALSTLGAFVLSLFLPGARGVDLAWLPGIGSSFSIDPNGAASVLVVVT